MLSPMRAVIIRHEEHEGPARLGEALAQAGFTAVPRFRSVAADDVHAELVVVLGGPMSACAVPELPFLRAERELLAARLRRGAPCLGICLGSQLLAAAAGALVSRGAAGLEIGCLPIRWLPAAAADDVIGEQVELVVSHWHEDTFSAVPGATLLASSARYAQQVFRLGDSFGFQCHVELDAPGFARWLEHGAAELAAAGVDQAALRAGLPAQAAHDARRQSLLERLARHFARSARRTA
jgi:GMP synthase (glutamine-hydrolysing)